ncbi:MAG: YhdH/YhfP family quinone oxidoreductase [Pirellulales bacterium]|nr:YhdH/YhfP family quinone oxidoreductase [Pirellulales bacterium]
MVRKADRVACRVETVSRDDLPAGDVLIEVASSSLNYKDALACRAHPGVVRDLPHVPGIDCAGHIVESTAAAFQPGQAVLVTGYDLGTTHWGGFAAYVRVPGEWVVPLPEGLSLEEAMTLGTAGFTAAQCVAALQHHGIQPDQGEIAVTGATGGVGSLAVALLAKLGYQVAAITGKPEQTELLKKLGAAQILPREAVQDASDKPLLRARWVAAVDTVGGDALAALLRSITHRGCVAACGLAGGHDLSTTVYPFILRGVTLAGIDSAQCPHDSRLQIWQRLAGPWRLNVLHQLARTITLSEVPAEVDRMLAGKSVGRVLVRPE